MKLHYITIRAKFVIRLISTVVLVVGTLNAHAGTELTVYTGLEANDLKKYAARFNEDYPDIKLNWVRDSTGVITAKLLAEKENPRADVVWGLAGTSLLMLANENMLAVYGEWMESAFGLQVAALGAITAVIGAADLSGEMLIALVSDRFGKRRMVLIAIAISAIGYAGLPWLGRMGLTAALFGLFVAFFGYEAAVVAGLLIISEVLPDARGTMISASIAASLLGRTVGALLGGLLWNAAGFELNGAVGGALNLLGMLLVLTVVTPAQLQVVERADEHT